MSDRARRSATGVGSTSAATSLPRFRAALARKARQVDEEAVERLEQEAQDLVRLYLARKQPPLRPSHMAREMAALAKALSRAGKALEVLGEPGLLHVFLASGASRAPDNVDLEAHLAYISRLSRWSRESAQTAGQISHSTRDHLGGRMADERLRRLVAQLTLAFAHYLGIKPTHTISKDGGVGVSLLDLFVHEAIATWRPEQVLFEPHRIDDAIRWALSVRDLEFFDPPLLSSSD